MSVFAKPLIAVWIVVSALFGAAPLLIGIQTVHAAESGLQANEQVGLVGDLSVLPAIRGGQTKLFKGTLLTVVEPLKMMGAQNNWAAAVVQDPAGNKYYVTAVFLEANVSRQITRAAIEVPGSALKAIPEITQPASAAKTCERPIARAVGVARVPDSTPPLASAPKASDVECVESAKHPACKQPCDHTPLPRNQRARFHQMILDAVNEQNRTNRLEGKREINPATVLSLIHVESSGNPLSERSDGGKGLAQFTFADVAQAAGLEYGAPKPKSLDVAFSPEFNRPAKNGLYSVWSPKGSIRAIVSKFSVDLNKSRFITVRDSKGGPVKPSKQIEVSGIYKKSDLHSARYLAGYHNRQAMVFSSVEEYYRQNGVLPREYGQTWEVHRKLKSTRPLLYKECINRCHVERVAGLCGDQPQGYFAVYSGDFQRVGAEWRVRTA